MTNISQDSGVPPSEAGAIDANGDLAAMLATFKPQESALWKQLIRRADDVVASRLIFGKAPDSARLLNLGCGPLLYAGWTNADHSGFYRLVRQPEFRPDWLLDATKRWRCLDDHWDGIFTQHVIEHFNYPDAVAVFRECLRTLRPGGWLRVSVPDIRKAGQHPYLSRLPLAVSFIAQHHQHKSVWDARLMTDLLADIGFTKAGEVEFNQGSDARLFMDQDEKRDESLYVEAQKPIHAVSSPS